MKYLRSFLEKRAVFALALNTVFLLAALFLFRPFFEETDDSSLAMIAEGAFGSRCPYLIYTNIMYGRLLTLLYALIPSVRWHSVLQYIFCFISFTLITYLLDGYRNGRLISALLLLSSFYEIYVSLQYSKTAALICLAGYISLIFATGAKSAGEPDRHDLKFVPEGTVCRQNGAKERVFLFAAGALLLIFGLCLRKECFFLATLFAGIFIAGIWIRELSLRGRGAIKELIKSYMKTFVPVFAVSFGLILLNTLACQSDGEWVRFTEYNDTRTELIDYRFDLLDYERYGEELEALGVSENDALLYLTWQFGDDSVFSVSKMREILDAPFAQGKLRWVETAKSFVRHIYDDILTFNPAFMGLMILAGACIAGLWEKYRNEKRKGGVLSYYPVLFLCSAALFVILVYFELSRRWSHRIIYAAFLMAMVILSFEVCLLWAESSVKEYTAIPAGVICISVLTACLGNHFDHNSYLRSVPEVNDYIACVSGDKERLYVADTFTFQDSFKYKVFEPLKEGELGNFVLAGSWYVNSPITRAVTSAFGYDNPYEALRAADDRVILSDNIYAAEKLLYLKEHYGEGFKLSEPSERAGIKEYRVIRESEE